MKSFNELVSVIVPVYNSSRYLSVLLDSLISQDYKKIEIILVNDGSDDNSLEIMNNYKDKDNRIKVINQKNLGVSAARNNGFNNSTGQYICFIDSDDKLEPDMIKNLINSIYAYKCDVACCNVHIYEKDGTERYTVNEEKIKIYNSLELLNMFLLGKISHACWDKLYKRNVLDRVNFPLGTTGEDRYFCWDLFKNINNMCVIPSVGYNYIRKNSDSITSIPLSEKNISRIEEALKLKVEILLYYPELYDKWKYYYYDGLKNLELKFIKENVDENNKLYRYFKFIKQELKEIKKEIKK